MFRRFHYRRFAIAQHKLAAQGLAGVQIGGQRENRGEH
jgi:hypothetical protein